ncbi:MAG: YfhO family protein, partial [Bacteroidia bacterium]|nr:YfhO family protein [Bacteroidia bacterium]
YYDETGEYSLWTNSMFSGMPTIQIWAQYPGNLITHAVNITRLGLPRSAALFFTYILGMYILLISLNFKPLASILGSLAFSFSTINILILMAGHLAKVAAVAYMMPILAGLFLAYRGKYLLGAALFAMFFAMQIRVNHVQITYYMFFMIAFIVLTKLIYAYKNKQLDKFIKASSALLVAIILGLAVNASALWTTYEYSKETIRGESELTTKEKKSGLEKDYAFGWSNGKLESFTLLIPGFYGGSSQEELGEKSETYEKLISNRVPSGQAKSFIKSLPLYWGDQPSTAGPVYFGAVICFLFLIGVLTVKSSERWWLLATIILTLMLSWGNNFTMLSYLFFDYFPMYNKFRAVSMILHITGICVLIMAMLGLRNITSQKKFSKETFNKVKLATYILGGICLVFALLGSTLFDFVGPSDEQLRQSADWLVASIREDRASMLQMDSLRSAFFIALSFGAIWYFYKNKVKKEYFIAAILSLAVIDLALVGTRYVSSADYQEKKQNDIEVRPTQVDLQIMQDTDPHYRVYNLTNNPFNDAVTSYFHKSIGGYHGAKLMRYQELIERHIGRGNQAVLNMLNTKYFITSPQQGGQPRAQRNPGALGNAWFVNDIQMVANADQEMEALNSFIPANTAIIDERFKDYVSNFTPNSDTSDVITLTEYKPNMLSYQSNSNSNRLAVFSEVYYNNEKGWDAYIDGELQPHIRVNYILRAINIPSGEHTIEFKFRPNSYYTGEKISLASSILLILFFVFAIGKELKPTLSEKKQKKK